VVDEDAPNFFEGPEAALGVDADALGALLEEPDATTGLDEDGAPGATSVKESGGAHGAGTITLL
jgi:hypothetical protein